MTRGLPAAALAAVTSEVVTRVIAAELAFPSGAVRVVAAPFDVTINSQVFVGVGLLGGISAIEENAELRSYGITLEMSGIPRTMVQVALTEQYQGRAAVVYEAQLDAARQVIAATVIFRGRMDVMEVLLGETATVRVSAENRLADWERPRARRYTHEDQIRFHPDDSGFSFVSATTEKTITWGRV